MFCDYCTISSYNRVSLSDIYYMLWSVRLFALYVVVAWVVVVVAELTGQLYIVVAVVCDTIYGGVVRG